MAEILKLLGPLFHKYKTTFGLTVSACSNISESIASLLSKGSQQDLTQIFKELEAFKSMLDIVLKSTQETNLFTDSFLSLFKASSNEHFKPVRVRELVDSVVAPFDQLGRISVKTEVADDLKIHCNTNLVSEAQNCLITNSIEALDGKEVKLIIEARESGNEVILSVKDNGPGLCKLTTAEAITLLHSTKKSDGGSGIGAWLVNVICLMHGGKLTYKNCQDGLEAIMVLKKEPFDIKSDLVATIFNETINA